MSKFLITGGTGFVGQQIVQDLENNEKCESIIITTRQQDLDGKTQGKVTYVLWDPLKNAPIKQDLSSVTTVINLMGENISSGRWSEERKKRIYQSRIDGTKNLVSLVKESCPALKSFVSTSAIGIYTPNTDEVIDEDTKTSNDQFLSKVCTDWEATLSELSDSIRTVIIRVGVVLDSDGGAIAKMKIPFLLGVGGILGDGKQFMSWIHRKDLSKIYIEASLNSEMSGAYNGVAPQPVTNQTFTKVLGSVIKRPTIFPVPGFILKLIFGDMASILLDGHRVIPRKLNEQKFEFNFPDIRSAFQNIF